MCENFPQYKEEYEKQIYKAINFTYIKDNSIQQLNNEKPLDPKVIEYIKKQLRESLPKLNKNKGIMIASTAIFSSLAAGFWAASWWFGITIPWAIACTSADIQSGYFIHSINEQINLINDFLDVDFYKTKDLIEKAIKNRKWFAFAIDSIAGVTIGTISLVIATCPPAAAEAAIVSAAIVALISITKWGCSLMNLICE